MEHNLLHCLSRWKEIRASISTHEAELQRANAEALNAKDWITRGRAMGAARRASYELQEAKEIDAWIKGELVAMDADTRENLIQKYMGASLFHDNSCVIIETKEGTHAQDNYLHRQERKIHPS